MPAAITKDPVLAEIARIRDRNRAKYEWRTNARPKQIAPEGNWRTWLVLAGRGFGKTRLGAEWVREQVESGRCKRLALIAPTAADCRDVIVEGESGILSISPPWNQPKYEPSNRRIVWPNGAQAFLFSAEEPERLRGPQFDGAWCDEIAAWQYMQETWDMLSFGLRLGKDPRRVVTTTPKPVQLLRELRAETHTFVTTGTTYENRENLAPAFFDQIISKYEGTRLGRQELEAELLDDVPDALWKQALINDLRVTETEVPELRRIVVGVDPAVTSSDESDETGIVVVGVGVNNHGYVLADYSLRGAPADWARAAIEAYRFHNADGIVAEVNQGGDMVEHTLRTIDPSVPYRAVRASRGKQRRAEPVSALYEQRRFHHAGTFRRLEEQMTQMTTGEYFGVGSPDHCFIAGTSIATERGPVAIENVAVGDRVWTRRGLSRVIATGMTNENAAVTEVTFSNGATLTATPNHPVYVAGKGFVSVDSLVWGDTIESWGSQENRWNSKGSCITDTRTLRSGRIGFTTRPTERTASAESQRCTATSGLRSMGRSQMGATSTIATTTRLTTTPRILSASPRASIAVSTPTLKNHFRDRLSTSKRTGPRPVNGTVPKLALNGIDVTVLHHGLAENLKRSLAYNAVVRSTALSPRERGSVPKPAYGDSTRRSSVTTRPANASCAGWGSESNPLKSSKSVPVSVVGKCDAGRAPVYNLTVEGAHEYYANCVLVHNCDALVWAATEAFIGGTGATMQVLPEFRPERRNGEPTEALHVIAPVMPQPWWYRWISLEYADGVGYAHWYYQDDAGRMHVYRELSKTGPSAEQFGAAIAEATVEQTAAKQPFMVWAPPELMKSGSAHKSVAQQVQEGFERAGCRGKFSIREADADEAAGWEYLRRLMRWQSVAKPQPPSLTREEMLALQADGKPLPFIKVEKPEPLPKLQIHTVCAALIRAIPGLSRDSSGKTSRASAFMPAWSLFCGAVGHFDIQAREPKAVRVERRMNEMLAGKTNVDPTTIAMVSMKAQAQCSQTYLSQQGYSFSRIQRRGRR